MKANDYAKLEKDYDFKRHYFNNTFLVENTTDGATYMFLVCRTCRNNILVQ
jgi:hypothetical protein